jgi:spore coat polysaccharide biosynthesis predicted glycosyltransferase SpsG
MRIKEEKHGDNFKEEKRKLEFMIVDLLKLKEDIMRKMRAFSRVVER